MPRFAWILLALIACVALLWAGVSHRIYMLTVPGDETWARKLLSIGAFAAIAFLADRALGPARRRTLRTVGIGAGFSLVVEVVQKLHHAPEDLVSNALDVAMGALGGLLAALVHGRTNSRLPRLRR